MFAQVWMGWEFEQGTAQTVGDTWPLLCEVWGENGEAV